MDEDLVYLAYGVLLDEWNRVLLLHRSNGLWELPGGEVVAEEDGRGYITQRLLAAVGQRIEAGEAIASAFAEAEDGPVKMIWYRMEMPLGMGLDSPSGIYDDAAFVEIDDLLSFGLTPELEIFSQKIYDGEVDF